MASARGLLGIIQLFGSLGLSAKPTDVSSSDSGVGVEGTEVLYEGKSDSDIGVGVDAGESMPGTIPDTETGVGVDAQEDIAVTLSSAETGAGVDTEGFSVTAPSVELGVMAESEAITVNISDSETGAGVDTSDINIDRKLTVVITSITTDITITIDWS